MPWVSRGCFCVNRHPDILSRINGPIFKLRINLRRRHLTTRPIMRGKPFSMFRKRRKGILYPHWIFPGVRIRPPGPPLITRRHVYPPIRLGRLSPDHLVAVCATSVKCRYALRRIGRKFLNLVGVRNSSGSRREDPRPLFRCVDRRA